MYQYLSFAGEWLLAANPIEDHGTGRAVSAIRPTIGGAVDVYGDNPTPVVQREIVISGVVIGAEVAHLVTPPDSIVTEQGDRIVTSESEQRNTESAIRSLRSLVGRRGALVRLNLATGTQETATARLLEVAHTTRPRDRMRIAELTLTFETIGNAFS